MVPCPAQHALHDACRHAMAAAYDPPQPVADESPVACARHPATLTVQYASCSCQTIAPAVGAVSSVCRQEEQGPLAATYALQVVSSMGGVRQAA